MRLQSKSSLRYVFKNFFFLLPFVIVPAIMMTFFMSENGPVFFLRDIFLQVGQGQEIEFTNFYKQVYSYFSFINFDADSLFGINGIWMWILTMIVTIFCWCLCFFAIERHIKFGTRTVGALFANVNESIMYLLPFMLLVFVAYELWMLFLSGAIVLFSLICSGWLFFAMAVVLTIIFYAAFFIVLSFLLLTPQSMYFDGYKFGFAASYSAQLIGQHFSDFVLPIVGSVAFTQLFIFVCNFVPQTEWMQNYFDNIILLIARFLCYIWWLIFLPGFTACKYASYTETKRADLKIKLFD